MARSSSKKAATEINTAETVVAKRGQQPSKVEAPLKGEKKGNTKAKAKNDSDDESLVTPKKSSAKVKVEKNVVKSETLIEEHIVPKQKALTKRKAKTQGDDDDGADDKATKKRKTKQEKEAEAMPLAARTVIGSMKKAMHIGAHVSAAGGTLFRLSH
jgi:AP endonuclease-1